MKRFRFFLIVGILSAVFTFQGLAKTGFQAGVSKINITPKQDIWLSGYASRNHPSEGKLHDLFAKAFAIDDSQGNQVVLVTTDLIGLPSDISERVCQRVNKQTGLPRSSIMLTSSHTHSGPVLRNNLETMYDLDSEQWNRITTYTKQLEDNLVTVICEAVKTKQPVSLFKGKGKAGFAVNRREYTSTGVKIGVNPIGPVDHDVPVLKAVDSSGKIMAIVFGYACHNTTLSIYKINGDYAGFAQIELEKKYPDAIALFFMGCGADSNPYPRREVEHAMAHGKELGQAVDHVLQQPMTPITGPIKSSFQKIDLSLTPAPTRSQIEEDRKSKNVYIQRRAQRYLMILNKERKIPETYPYPVQAWKIGDDFLWLALAGEVVVDYSLLFKHLYGPDKTWVTAYANDVFAYIPSLRVLREGGYESDTSMIYYGWYGPWKEDVEKRIVKTVQKMVEQMDS